MSNDYKISKDTLYSKFPDVLKQSDTINNLGTLTAQAMADRMSEINRLSVFYCIDNLPESILDILAQDLNVPWYDYNYDVATKRKVIKNCFNVHRKLGTAGALKAAIQSIYPNLTVQEWWEYDEDPFKFRVVLDLSEEIGNVPIITSDVLKIIDVYKPSRAVLATNGILISGQEKISAADDYTANRLLESIESGESSCSATFTDNAQHSFTVELVGNWDIDSINRIARCNVFANITDDISISNIFINNGSGYIGDDIVYDVNYAFKAGETMNFQYVIRIIR